MSEGKLVKMEKDYSNEVDQLLTQVQPLVQGGQIEQALEKILSLEKQTRNGADLASTTKLLVASVEITRGANLWARLNEIVILLSKKHGQLKQAIVSMVQKAMTYLDETPDMETKLQLINTLRQVTEGKIFVEVERARVTLYLAKIHENEGKISEAADILQELQVETFGSMEKREKTEFLLEQMRLCLANGDYVRTLIISRKIGLNFFKNEENHDLKLRFYELMIQYASHENNYLDISKHYLEVYHTPSVQADDAKKKQALEQALIYVMLSPYDNEQSDLIHRIMQDPYLEKSAQHKELGTSFTTIELIRWPSLQELYGKSLLSIDPFVRGTEQGAKRWDDLHSRVIEHNIRVIEKYYTHITLKRMTELLDLDLDQTEDVLAKLVVSKTIYAKIDRPSGIVNFQAPKDANTILNEWTHDINKLLSLVEKTNHLIAKEEMVHKIVVRK